MPVAVALIFGVVVLAAVVFGILWALIFLVPFYVYVCGAAYMVWRARQREADAGASIQREAEQQRSMNDQEMRAWQATLGNDQRNAAKREKALRDFDRSRGA